MRAFSYFLTLMIFVFFALGCNPNKTTISGEVFIATASGLNIRLGAVGVEIVESNQFISFLEQRKSEIANAKQELEDAKKANYNYVIQKGFLTDTNYINELMVLEKQENQLVDELQTKSAKINQLKEINSAYNDKVQKIVWQLTTLNYVYQGGANRTTLENQMRVLFNIGNAILQEHPDPIRTDLEANYFQQEIEIIKQWRTFISDLIDTNLNIGIDAYTIRQKINNTKLQKSELEERYCAKVSNKIFAAEERLRQLKNSENIMGSLHSITIANTTTDSDGKYTINCPRKNGLMLVCNASRAVLNDTENYHWIIEVPTKSKSRIDLNNHNLTDTDTLLTGFR
jgi:hypothetical protein